MTRSTGGKGNSRSDVTLGCGSHSLCFVEVSLPCRSTICLSVERAASSFGEVICTWLLEKAFFKNWLAYAECAVKEELPSNGVTGSC